MACCWKKAKFHCTWLQISIQNLAIQYGINCLTITRSINLESLSRQKSRQLRVYETVKWFMIILHKLYCNICVLLKQNYILNSLNIKLYFYKAGTFDFYFSKPCAVGGCIAYVWCVIFISSLRCWRQLEITQVTQVTLFLILLTECSSSASTGRYCLKYFRSWAFKRTNGLATASAVLS